MKKEIKRVLIRESIIISCLIAIAILVLFGISYRAYIAIVTLFVVYYPIYLLIRLIIWGIRKLMKK